jgi:hypothetical protein
VYRGREVDGLFSIPCIELKNFSTVPWQSIASAPRILIRFDYFQTISYTTSQRLPPISVPAYPFTPNGICKMIPFVVVQVMLSGRLHLIICEMVDSANKSRQTFWKNGFIKALATGVCRGVNSTDRVGRERMMCIVMEISKWNNLRIMYRYIT